MAVKPFTLINAPQRSEAWYEARAGRLTGSQAHLLFVTGKKKGEESKQRRDYRLQLVSERITGQAQYERAGLSIYDVQRGQHLEPLAFASYEARYGEMVETSGFLAMNDYMAGCSLDGHVGNYEGIIELKCPKQSTHLTYLGDSGALLLEYISQCRHNLWVSGAKYCDLISFDDRFPKHKQLVRVRISRDEAQLAEYAHAAVQFLDEVSLQTAQINDGAYT